MAAVSRAEYLKRYMSKDQLPKEDKKKKRKKTKQAASSRSGLKIIDDDVDFKRRHGDGIEEMEDEEEAPLVAEVVDERPKHVQQLEAYRKNNRWKVLGKDGEDESASMDYGVIKSFSPEPIGSQSKRSPPRRRRHDSSDSDQGPPRRKRHDSSSASDQSPVRKASAKKGNSVTLMKAGKRHDSDADASPPRRNKTNKGRVDSDTSPRRQSSSSLVQSSHHVSKVSHTTHQKAKPLSNQHSRHDSDSDMSPIRTKEEQSDSDHSPVRRRKHGSVSDSSPVRKKKDASDSDQSPPRKGDLAATTKHSNKRRHDSDSDPSPPRKNRSQISPVRGRKSDAVSESHKRSRKSRFDKSDDEGERPQKAAKTLGGAKAGLSSAREMREEAKKLREKEEKSFQNIDESTLGRNAKTVLRDKETGKRRNMQAESEKNAEEEKKKEEQMKKYEAWGKGVKQAKDREATLQHQVHEAMKPLARYSDDADLDTMQRQEERAEDPMLAFIQKRRKKEEEKAGVKKKKELPRYKGPAPPPNRFNIMPGYRWDGVDRSNGFEKKIFAHRANKTAVKEMAYKWSTEDM